MSIRHLRRLFEVEIFNYLNCWIILFDTKNVEWKKKFGLDNWKTFLIQLFEFILK